VEDVKEGRKRDEREENVEREKITNTVEEGSGN
jgi:hypothetical protein